MLIIFHFFSWHSILDVNFSLWEWSKRAKHIFQKSTSADFKLPAQIIFSTWLQILTKDCLIYLYLMFFPSRNYKLHMISYLKILINIITISGALTCVLIGLMMWINYDLAMKTAMSHCGALPDWFTESHDPDVYKRQL